MRLITGGAGFIGSHLADAYLGRGDEVLILDDLSTGSIDNIRHLRSNPRFHYTIESVHHAPSVAELVDQCDVVFHLAAAVGVPDGREPGPYDRNQRPRYRGGTGPGQQEKEEGPDRVDLRGLRAGVDVPFREDGNLVLGPTAKGRWSYACLKAIDEFLALAYWRRAQAAHGDCPAVQHRRTAQTGQYGMVVPTFVKQALTGRPITIHGDGCQSRCFTDVSDVVGALIALMDHPAAVGEVFDIGSSEEVTIRAWPSRSAA